MNRPAGFSAIAAANAARLGVLLLNLTRARRR
jgi:hypothetical protein